MRLITSSFLLILLFPMLQSCGTTSQAKVRGTRSTIVKAPSKTAGLVRTADKYLGSAYKYGGNGPRQFDCSGLVKQVFAENNIELPRTSAAQSVKGKKVPLSAVRPGDLLFFSKHKNGGGINHVALVVEVKNGGYWAIHSTTSRGVIKEDILNSSYWGDRFRFARRVQSGA